MITRERAQALLDTYLKTNYLKLHSRESEVILRAIAKELGEDEDLWGITALLHDLDMDEIGLDEIETSQQHALKTCEILEKEFGDQVPEEMKHAILAHVEDMGYAGVKRESKLDYALAAGESLSGFIVACALVQPDKKLESVRPESVLKKFKKKEFARKVPREIIYDIEKIGLTKERLVEIALSAMQEISDEIGL